MQMGDINKYGTWEETKEPWIVLKGTADLKGTRETHVVWTIDEISITH